VKVVILSGDSVNPKPLTDQQEEAERPPPPLVSVIIPTYKHENYIAQALQSVLDQRTAFAVEILVGEDCSPDGTLERIKAVMEANPGRITLHAYPKNMGGHENFEFLWTRCQGKYIAWLEGDDFWTDPYKLQKQADCLEQDDSLTFCFHNAIALNQETQALGPVYPDFGDEPRRVGFKTFLFLNRAHTCSVMYRAGIVPGFPSWIYALPIGDWPMHIMHAIQGDALYIPDCMATYRMHHGGLWSHQSHAHHLEGAITVLQAVRDNIGAEYYPDTTKAVIVTKADLTLFQSGHGHGGVAQVLEDYKSRWSHEGHREAGQTQRHHDGSTIATLSDFAVALDEVFAALMLSEAAKADEHSRLQLIEASRGYRVLRAYAGLFELPLVRPFMLILRGGAKLTFRALGSIRRLAAPRR